MSGKNCEKYRNKLILAPMVKIGTLPTRLLALRYGADLVYSEEIIDWRLLSTRRVVNEMLGITEYVGKDGSVVFSTCEEERGNFILQIGCSDAERAVKVLEMVQEDISGIDLNCGCPKEFSIKGGMGAALLKNPEKIRDILSTLVAKAKIPVTAKIRVLSTIEETIELALLIQSCGVSALAVHGRNVNERPQHSNRNDFIKAVAEKLDIPTIANGGSKEIASYEDILKFKAATGADSVMIARAGEWNLSIFRKDGKIEMDQVIREFLKLSVMTDNPFSNVKYTIQNILRELQDTPRGRKFLDALTIAEMCEIWDLQDFYKEKNAEWTEFKRRKRTASTTEHQFCVENDPKKIKMDNPIDESILIVPDCVFIRGHYNSSEELPKSLLLKWCRCQGGGDMPKYRTQCSDKKFISVVSFLLSSESGEKKFMTDVWEKNKKQAEQGSALAACRFLKLIPPAPSL